MAPLLYPRAICSVLLHTTRTEVNCTVVVYVPSQAVANKRQGPDDAGPCAYANAVSIKGFDVFTARRQSTPSNRSDDGSCDN